MTTVVLRCPLCGTTQSHTGECDACSESAVRYFCTNHTPGLWLDEPECKTCGAKFGVTSKEPRTPPARTTSRPPPRSSARSEPPRARPRDAEPRRDPDRVPDPIIPPATPSMAELLARLLAARRKRTGYDTGDAWGTPPPAVPRLRLGGCLVRLMLLSLLLMVLGVAGSFIFVGSVLQFFGAVEVQSVQLRAGHAYNALRRL